MELQTMPLRFRVWDKEENIFIKAGRVGPQSWPCKYNHTTHCFEIEDDERFIISQDTGMKDKNGKSIFTGDILFSGIYYVEVRYEYGEVVGYRPKDGVYCGFLELMQLRGNIWQNPELLEDKTIDKS